MNLAVREAKAALRQRVRQELRRMSSLQRETHSAQAREILAAQPVWKAAKSILFFAPLPEEIDIWPLVDVSLAEGKCIALPHFDEENKRYAVSQVQNPGTELVSGQFGIREPARTCAKVSLNRLDLVLAPGIAFDLHGGRLGRGKGFYDQMLAEVRGRICGVAFDNQIVSAVPVEPHDAHVDCILTPTRWLECQRAVLE